MNTNDIIDLLTYIVAYDRRTTGRADVIAWHDAATRANWTTTEAQEAVKIHFTHSTEWLMPGHITQIIKTNRRQPPPHKNQLALTSPPAQTHTRNQAMNQIRATLKHPKNPQETS
jgi:hypothetical protein